MDLLTIDELRALAPQQRAEYLSQLEKSERHALMRQMTFAEVAGVLGEWAAANLRETARRSRQEQAEQHRQ